MSEPRPDLPRGGRSWGHRGARPQLTLLRGLGCRGRFRHDRCCEARRSACSARHRRPDSRRHLADASRRAFAARVLISDADHGRELEPPSVAHRDALLGTTLNLPLAGASAPRERKKENHQKGCRDDAAKAHPIGCSAPSGVPPLRVFRRGSQRLEAARTVEKSNPVHAP